MGSMTEPDRHTHQTKRKRSVAMEAEDNDGASSTTAKKLETANAKIARLKDSLLNEIEQGLDNFFPGAGDDDEEQQKKQENFLLKLQLTLFTCQHNLDKEAPRRRQPISVTVPRDVQRALVAKNAGLEGWQDIVPSDNDLMVYKLTCAKKGLPSEWEDVLKGPRRSWYYTREVSLGHYAYSDNSSRWVTMAREMAAISPHVLEHVMKEAAAKGGSNNNDDDDTTEAVRKDIVKAAIDTVELIGKVHY